MKYPQLHFVCISLTTIIWYELMCLCIYGVKYNTFILVVCLNMFWCDIKCIPISISWRFLYIFSKHLSFVYKIKSVVWFFVCLDQWSSFLLLKLFSYIYIIISKNIRYLLWNRGTRCFFHDTYLIIEVQGIRCTNHLHDSWPLTDVNPHFTAPECRYYFKMVYCDVIDTWANR